MELRNNANVYEFLRSSTKIAELASTSNNFSYRISNPDVEVVYRRRLNNCPK